MQRFSPNFQPHRNYPKDLSWYYYLPPPLLSPGFPGGSDGKEPACNAGEPGSIPGSGRSLGEGNGYPLQYSCVKNSMDREARWATVHAVAVSDTTEQLTLSFPKFNTTLWHCLMILYFTIKSQKLKTVVFGIYSN